MTEKPTRAALRNHKLRKVAGGLFLKRGYDGVTIDQIVDLAGGSKSTVYSEFGGKCGLFISSIEELCQESTEPLTRIDYTGLGLRHSLTKLGIRILKLVTAKRSVDLHRLAIGEAAHCPEVGVAWYTHGPARTASIIADVLQCHAAELGGIAIPLDQLAVVFYDALTGDVLDRRLAGIGKPPADEELARTTQIVVDAILANLCACARMP